MKLKSHCKVCHRRLFNGSLRRGFDGSPGGVYCKNDSSHKGSIGVARVPKGTISTKPRKVHVERKTSEK